ncbi:YciI family protein [Thalassococcus lentus]|uniref:YciI family protein n=1 Tax=Thalassococcus lentus TaxID=1210524 RepID=A0ABT4XNC8_9RHOB|nr:YciI family protein [Thalassococcus lentus]MDA7423443.1 YciI family protein [Thalassococcus lentus]
MSIFEKGQSLFAVDIHYDWPFDRIEPLIDDHMVFIKQGFDDGTFLVAGPKVPRNGGMILASAPSREALEQRMAQDPFCTAGAVTVTITEFRANTISTVFES